MPSVSSSSSSSSPPPPTDQQVTPDTAARSPQTKDVDVSSSAAKIDIDEAAAAENGAPPKSINYLKWVCAVLTLLFGVNSVMALKLQSLRLQPINSAGDMDTFEQPFWQTTLMFCGEAMCFFVWVYDDQVVKKRWGRRLGLFEFGTEESLARRPTPLWWWIVPTLCDLFGTACVNVAFTMTYGSTVSMLRNFMLIIMAISSLLLLRRPLRVHEWLGIFVMTAGMIAAGIMAMVNPDQNAVVDASKSWIGIVLSLVGTTLNALHLSLEEKVFEKTYTPPLKVVGIEGFIGILSTLIIIIICHFAGWYNFAHGWYQMNHSALLIGTNIWYLLASFFFNGAGLMTTFLGGAVLRGVIFSFRAPFVFLIELAARLQAFTWGGFASLILTTLGFFIYSYLIPYVNRNRTPKAHKILRQGVPCFCTNPLPETDLEDGGAPQPKIAHKEDTDVDTEAQQL